MKQDHLISSSPVWMLFIAFSCLIALIRQEKEIKISFYIDRNGKRGHPVLWLKGKKSIFYSWVWVFPGGSQVKNAGDTGLIPGLGRSPGVGNGNPLQYSFLGNSMNRGAWWATVCGFSKSQTRLSEHKSTIEYIVSYGFFINDLYYVEFHSIADKLLNDI